jgi:hypothetical protein
VFGSGVRWRRAVPFYFMHVWFGMRWNGAAPELEYSSNMLNHPPPKNPPNRAIPFSCARPPPMAPITHLGKVPPPPPLPILLSMKDLLEPLLLWAPTSATPGLHFGAPTSPQHRHLMCSGPQPMLGSCVCFSPASKRSKSSNIDVGGSTQAGR